MLWCMRDMLVRKVFGATSKVVRIKRRTMYVSDDTHYVLHLCSNGACQTWFSGTWQEENSGGASQTLKGKVEKIC